MLDAYTFDPPVTIPIPDVILTLNDVTRVEINYPIRVYTGAEVKTIGIPENIEAIKEFCVNYKDGDQHPKTSSDGRLLPMRHDPPIRIVNLSGTYIADVEETWLSGDELRGNYTYARGTSCMNHRINSEMWLRIIEPIRDEHFLAATQRKSKLLAYESLF